MLLVAGGGGGGEAGVTVELIDCKWKEGLETENNSQQWDVLLGWNYSFFFFFFPF